MQKIHFLKQDLGNVIMFRVLKFDKSGFYTELYLSVSKEFEVMRKFMGFSVEKRYFTTLESAFFAYSDYKPCGKYEFIQAYKKAQLDTHWLFRFLGVSLFPKQFPVRFRSAKNVRQFVPKDNVKQFNINTLQTA